MPCSITRHDLNQEQERSACNKQQDVMGLEEPVLWFMWYISDTLRWGDGGGWGGGGVFYTRCCHNRYHNTWSDILEGTLVSRNSMKERCRRRSCTYITLGKDCGHHTWRRSVDIHSKKKFVRQKFTIGFLYIWFARGWFPQKSKTDLKTGNDRCYQADK